MSSMTSSELLAAVILTLVFISPALLLACVAGGRPPARGTWLYPDPDRRGYHLKLYIYATIDALYSPQGHVQRINKWFTWLVVFVMFSVVMGGLLGRG